MRAWRSWSPFAGALILIGAVEWYLYAPGQWPGALALGLGGLAAMLAPTVLAPRGSHHPWSAARVRSGLHAGILTLAVIAILVLINVVAARHPLRYDTTAAGRYSLSDQTRAVLRDLDQPVTFRAFVRSGSRQGGRITQLLEQYAYHSDQITVAPAVDPEKRPGLARRHDIQRFNTVLARTSERTQKIPPGDLFQFSRFGGGPSQFQGEQALTRTLLSLTREGLGTLYFVTGHGEAGSKRVPGRLTDALKGEGYGVADLNLARAGEGGIPEDAAALILAGPRQDYAEAELERLQAYLQDGGRLLALVGPRTEADSRLAQWLAQHGIRPRPGVVVDPERHYFVDSLSPIPTYRQHPVTAELQESELGMVVPDARPLTLSKGKQGPRPQPLLRTSSASWGEMQPQAQPLEQGDDDRPGPLVVAAALGGSGPPAEGGARPGQPGNAPTAQGTDHPGRLLVVGSSSLIGRKFLGFQGNLDFFLNGTNWLAGQEEQITIRPQPASQRRVRLSGDSAWFISFTTVIGLPALVLVFGIYHWWRRRFL